MSIAIMADVWPLQIGTTDKIVLLALSDAANDDGLTWVPLKSKQATHRSGRPKLNLIVKTNLSERAIQGSIKRLVQTGHITREEKPGIGVDYLVHPVIEEPDCTPAGGATMQHVRGAARAGAPASGAG